MPNGISQSPAELLDAIKSYATGAIKGNTADILGAPVDIINAAISPVTKALGIHSENPVGGSKTFRRLLNQSIEDANPAETVGSMISLGGAAKAMIVGAARLGKIHAYVNPQRAGELIEKSTPISEIYNRSGAYMDKDAILKSVISDKDVTLKMSGFENIGGELVPKYNPETGSVKLSDIINAPTHFRLYPELKDTIVKEDISGRGGSMALNNKVMTVQAFTPPMEKDILGIILHEFQHGIQNIEGFTPGSNTTQFLGNLDPAKALKNINTSTAPRDKATMEAAERYKAIIASKEKEARNRYLNVGGEQEARFTQENTNLTEPELATKVLDMLRSGNTPQNYDTRPIRSIFGDLGPTTK